MQSRIIASLLGVLLIGLSMSGCATNDYDIDVDALLRELEMEAGHDYEAPAPAARGTADAPAADVSVMDDAMAAPASTGGDPVSAAPEPAPPGELTIQAISGFPNV